MPMVQLGNGPALRKQEQVPAEAVWCNGHLYMCACVYTTFLGMIMQVHDENLFLSRLAEKSRPYLNEGGEYGIKRETRS